MFTLRNKLALLCASLLLSSTVFADDYSLMTVQNLTDYDIYMGIDTREEEIWLYYEPIQGLDFYLPAQSAVDYELPTDTFKMRYAGETRHVSVKIRKRQRTTVSLTRDLSRGQELAAVVIREREVRDKDVLKGSGREVVYYDSYIYPTETIVYYQEPVVVQPRRFDVNFVLNFIRERPIVVMPPPAQHHRPGPHAPSRPPVPSRPIAPSRPIQTLPAPAPNRPIAPPAVYTPSRPNVPTTPRPSAPPVVNTPSRPSTPPVVSTPSRPNVSTTPSRPSAPPAISTPSRPNVSTTPSRPSAPPAVSTPSRPNVSTTPSRPSAPPAVSTPSRPNVSTTPSRPAPVPQSIVVDNNRPMPARPNSPSAPRPQ